MASEKFQEFTSQHFTLTFNRMNILKKLATLGTQDTRCEMINIQAGGFYTYNYQAMIFFYSFVSLMFIKSVYLLSSNVWFSDVPDKDKEIDTAAMYVILYFIK
jgi:hypothetical protein